MGDFKKRLPAIIVTVIFTVIIAVSAQAPALAETAIGAVKKIKSDAYGTLVGASKSALRTKDGVFMQEIVETVTEGALHITFADDTVLRLGSASQVTLDQFVYNPGQGGGQMVVRLGKGVFRFISGKMAKSGVTILTPTAIIGIRGTNFVVAVDDDGATSISVDEGVVQVSPNEGGGAATSISVGQIATVSTSTSAVSVSTGTSVSQDPGLSEGTEATGGEDDHAEEGHNGDDDHPDDDDTEDEGTEEVNTEDATTEDATTEDATTEDAATEDSGSEDAGTENVGSDDDHGEDAGEHEDGDGEGDGHDGDGDGDGHDGDGEGDGDGHGGEGDGHGGEGGGHGEGGGGEGGGGGDH